MPCKAACACLALCLAATAAAALAPPAPARLLAWLPFGRRSPGHLHSEAAEAHRVHSLPGWGKLSTRLYSGEVPISKDKAMFYALVEADCRHPEDAPVVLWLTGGPGCSSVGTAFIGEHGPFFPRPGSTSRLMQNPYSYHTLPANMLYLDAPVGVGFSYSNSSDDYKQLATDKGMATDMVDFIREWRKLFPRLARAPFWLAGESYAGHYVPHITLQLLEHAGQAMNSGEERIDFKGFLLGNPSTDEEYDNEGRLTFWWSHGLISQNVKKAVEHHCNFSEVIITQGIEVKTKTQNRKCEKAVQQALSEMGPIKMQNVFGDKCLDKRFTSATPPAPSWLARLLPARLARMLGSKHHPDPCITEEGEAYLARSDVQEALHANRSGALDWSYKGCTEGEVFKYSVDDQLDSMLPLYRRINKDAPHLRTLIYTGDADGMVPLTGTRRWVLRLGTEEGKREKRHWTHWMDPNGQVGGYLEEYEDFTFVTVRRAGHEAPYTGEWAGRKLPDAR
ncbi:serine carboxypeptidase-like 34 [Chlorella sorokiniana]|uniref:Carboxypeptidase n=1 Tax=Chlorella sorokiniana TaxID=3076 RepID=A0A2P6TVC4_CHLSO|nr:serine carboxypeptidase-like 34 [Chlorella sorokiniana]|eukprot:PRW58008.1 serine carboxypeptidase-like 34 [Chlorella sorokiniana]